MLPDELLLEPAWQRVAVVLLHFLWQGVLVAAVYAVVAQWLLRRPPQRYAAGVIALLAMAGCLPTTYFLVEAPANSLVWEEFQAASATAVPHFAAVISDYEQPPEPVALSSAGAGMDAMTSQETSTNIDRGAGWRAELNRRIVGVWLLGVLIFSLRLLSGAIGLRMLTGRTTTAPSEHLELMKRLGRSIGFGRLPRLVVSPRVAEAIATGFFRPVIVLPTAWLAELPPAVIEAVLAHELAHIRRYDLWVNLLQRAVEAVLFFHPAVWWLSREVRSDREMCCDELAVKATGHKVAYVSALEVVARRAARAPLFSLATGIGGRKMQLLERVRHVLGLPARRQPGGWWAAGVVALAVPCGLWVLSGPAAPRAFAQDEEREEQEERDEGDREDREEREERGDREEREDRDEADDREDREDRGDRDRGERSPEARAAREAREAREARREAERRRDREVREREGGPREEREVEVELEFRRERPGLFLERRTEAEAQRRLAQQGEQKARARQQEARADIQRAHTEVQRRMAEAQRRMADQMRQAAERGEHEKVEAMRREVEEMRRNAEQQVRELEEQMRFLARDREQGPDSRRLIDERIERGFGVGRARLGDRPGMEDGINAQREMLQMIRELRNEVQELRREVRELREGRAGKERPQVERRKESAKVPILGDVPYVGRLFRNEEEEITIEVKKDSLKRPKDVKVELSKGPTKVDGFRIEVKKDPVEKSKNVNVEYKKDPVKLDGLSGELKLDPIEKAKNIDIEIKNVPVEKIKGAEIEFKQAPVEKTKDVEIEFNKAPVEKKEAVIELKSSSLKHLKKAELDLRSSLEKAVQQDVDVRYATKATELAKVELEKALAANRKTAKAIADAEIERMKLTLERGLQELDRAKRASLDRLLKVEKQQKKKPAGGSDGKEKPAEPKK